MSLSLMTIMIIFFMKLELESFKGNLCEIGTFELLIYLKSTNPFIYFWSDSIGLFLLGDRKIKPISNTV